MSERTCSKCGLSKPETGEFFRRRGTKDRGGLRPDCRECSAKRDREFFLKNRDRIRAYRATNAERIAAYQAAYMPQYYRTPTGRAAMKRAAQRWYASDSGRLMAALASQRRRARKASVPGVFIADDWIACVAAFDGTCAYCGVRTDLTQDHVVPILSGGANDPSNIVPACLSCNSGKCAKALADWFPLQPFYDETRMVRLLAYLELIMSRIYLPETEAADPDDSATTPAAEPAGQGRIYVQSSESAAEETAAADDDGDSADSAVDQDKGKDAETVTVTEPAQTEPSPPPAKKATSQRGKASS